MSNLLDANETLQYISDSKREAHFWRQPINVPATSRGFTYMSDALARVDVFEIMS